MWNIVDDLLGGVIGEFVLPGIVAAFVLTYVIYKICKSYGWL